MSNSGGGGERVPPSLSQAFFVHQHPGVAREHPDINLQSGQRFLGCHGWAAFNYMCVCFG